MYWSKQELGPEPADLVKTEQIKQLTQSNLTLQLYNFTTLQLITLLSFLKPPNCLGPKLGAEVEEDAMALFLGLSPCGLIKVKRRKLW